MAKSTKQVKRPQLKVFIPELDKTFPSGMQAAKALIENVTGPAARLQSISGRVSGRGPCRRSNSAWLHCAPCVSQKHKP